MSDLGLGGSVALVTGAAGGIGRAICETLAQLQAIAAQAVDVPAMLAALPPGVAYTQDACGGSFVLA